MLVIPQLSLFILVLVPFALKVVFQYSGILHYSKDFQQVKVHQPAILVDISHISDRHERETSHFMEFINPSQSKF